MSNRRKNREKDWVAELEAEIEADRLHKAAEQGDISAMEDLIGTGADINRLDFMGTTPLCRAAERGHVQAAHWLLSHGADADRHDEASVSDTPLVVAVRGDSPAMVKLLLGHGADPLRRGWMGLTPLVRAERRDDETGKVIADILRRHVSGPR